MTISSRAMHVLVVDDEQNIREGVTRILERSGFRVTQASSGEEALSVMAENRADITILDLIMPGVGGLEVLDAIKESYSNTLVIIITGFATSATARQARSKGAFDFLTKPFAPNELRLSVQRAVECINQREIEY